MNLLKGLYSNFIRKVPEEIIKEEIEDDHIVEFSRTQDWDSLDYKFNVLVIGHYHSNKSTTIKCFCYDVGPCVKIAYGKIEKPKNKKYFVYKEKTGMITFEEYDTYSFNERYKGIAKENDGILFFYNIEYKDAYDFASSCRDNFLEEFQYSKKPIILVMTRSEECSYEERERIRKYFLKQHPFLLDVVFISTIENINISNPFELIIKELVNRKIRELSGSLTKGVR